MYATSVVRNFFSALLSSLVTCNSFTNVFIFELVFDFRVRISDVSYFFFSVKGLRILTGKKPVK